jgi:hypothetical protein
MELSKLRERLKTATMEREDDRLEVTFNADAFTADFFRSLAASMRARLTEIDAPQKPARKPRARKGAARSKAGHVGLALTRSLDIQAAALEVERDLYAEVLAKHVLRGWSVTEGGAPVAPSFAVLQTLTVGTLKAIFDFCVEQSNPKAQPAPETSASRTT